MSSIALTLRRIDEASRGLVSLFLNVGRLRGQTHGVVFPSEGGLAIRMPPVTYRDLLSHDGRTRIRQCVRYSGRPTAETLLRKTVFRLLQSGYLDPGRSIIDIGSWIGDNAVVWAKLLSDGGVVFAVDPSRANLAFGKAVAGSSSVNNIHWIQAVCADEPGLGVSLCGDLEHAQFSNGVSPHAQRFLTTTLDEVVPAHSHGAISLLHVDVEGFEKKVLLGARQIIARSSPVVIFEQHIAKEDPREIVNLLTPNGYAVFMINEVIPGCDLDCRNFIAFPTSRAIPPIVNPPHHEGRHEQIWYASLGPALLPVA